MTWMEHSLPNAYNAKKGQEEVNQLKDEVAFLEEELAKERQANREIQTGIIGRRKRSDELVAMMTLLRSETGAILQRHNILLDSPQAKQAAKELHEEALKTRAKEAETEGEEGKTAEENSPAEAKENETDENDGDDEGDGLEEEGEIKGSGEWEAGGAKRDLEEGFGESPANRKRRKV